MSYHWHLAPNTVYQQSKGDPSLHVVSTESHREAETNQVDMQVEGLEKGLEIGAQEGMNWWPATFERCSQGKGLYFSGDQVSCGEGCRKMI
jgi:hypothetical protein